MNIFNKVALRGLVKNRTRTIVTIIGIVLSAGLITAAVTFRFSLMDYAAAGASLKYGSWHVEFMDVDSSFVQERSGDPEVKSEMVTENIGYARLQDGMNPDKPYLYITSFGEDAFKALPQTLISGRMPENSGEILIPTHLQSNGGVELAVGDTISLMVGNRMNGDQKLSQHDPYTADETFQAVEEQTYEIVGICSRPAFEEQTAPGYTVITKTDANARADSLNLFVTLEKPAKARTYAADYAGNYGYTFNSNVLRFLGIMTDSSDGIFMAFLYAIAGIVIAIIMVGSVFLIYNSFSISLGERTQQIGILASVGATGRQIRNSVLFEGLMLGIIAIPLGILAGVGGIWLVVTVVAPKFSDIMYSGVPLTLHISGIGLIGAAIISLITILISAYIPAKKAACIPVMDCIRQTSEVKLESKSVKTSKFAHQVYGLEGILALKNFKRNKKRYRSIVLSLVLSVVLFISTSTFVDNLNQAMSGFSTFTTYDIGFGTQDMDEGEMLNLYEKLKGVSGITGSSYQSLLNYTCVAPVSEFADDNGKVIGTKSEDGTVEFPIQIQLLDDKTYLDLVKKAGLNPAEYTGENAKLLTLAKMQKTDKGKDGEKLAGDFYDLFKNPSEQVSIIPEVNGEPLREQSRKVELTCAEIIAPDIPPTKDKNNYLSQNDYFFNVMVPWSLKDQFISEDLPTDVLVKGLTFSSEDPSKSTAQMREIIRGANLSSAYMFFNSAEAFKENKNYVFIANIFAYTFIVMISLIAVANVFNTISTNIKLRRCELAMLRSVGMSDKDFNKMMRFECAFYGMRALLVGLPLSLLTSYLIYAGMQGKEDGMVFRMPWGSMGISVLGVLAIIFVTMMYAVSKIKKENIIDALRDDMT